MLSIIAAINSLIVTLQTTDSTGVPVGAYTSAGATTAAVTALIWTVRKAISGELVAKSTAEAEAKFLKLLEASSDRENKLLALIEDNRVREDRLYELFKPK